MEKPTTCFDCFPRDVVSNILCRLQVKYLKRYQCVCKSWYALINDQAFVTQHLQFNSRHNKNTHGFLFRPGGYLSLVNLDESTDDIVSIDWLKISNSHSYREANYYSDQETKFYEYWCGSVQISGPRNGIYCFYNLYTTQKYLIALVNVSVREFKLVPNPEQSIFYHPGYHVNQLFVDFGFDPRTNDYKVIFYVECCRTLEDYFPKAAIYQLSSNSWKKVNDPLLNHAKLWESLCTTDTYVNGNVHRLCSVDDELHILSFDMIAEVFAKMKLPDLRVGMEDTECVIAVSNECLSLIVYPRQHLYKRTRTKCFDIWVMQDYGNEDSWTKQVTIGPARLERLVGLWGNGMLFFEEEPLGYIVCYDQSTKKTKKQFTEGIQLDQCFVYSESLVSVTRNGRNDFELIPEDRPIFITQEENTVSVLGDG